MIAGHVPAGHAERTPAPLVALAADRVQVERRPTLGLEAEDAEAYDAILHARPEVGAFLSRAWLSGLFDELPNQAEPALLLFRDGGALKGFVPISVHVSRTHARVSLLGAGLGSDRVDLMAGPGAEVACADAFLTWLAATFGDRGFVLDLRDVPADSPLWGALHRAGLRGDPKVTLSIRDIQPLPWLNLVEYARNAGAPDSLDKHRRWLEKRGAVWTDLVRDPEEALAGFDTLATFLRERWAGHGGSALDEAGRHRFHRRILPRLLDEGRLRMIRLSADGRAVAIFYGLALGTWWGYYLAGYDREWAGRIHLGRLTLATAIEQATRHGATEFDFLKGAESVKYLWPVEERTTIEAEVASHHSTAQLTRVAHAARETAAALSKTARAWTKSR